MIVTMIMNGSILSFVYPFSIFIYALLEERRPSGKYWMFIVYYTAVVLVLKFMFQTYPLSDWLRGSNGNDANDQADQFANNTVNDFLRTIRIGLEVVEDGRNFVEFFLFEALILLSVTLHIFVQVFGGVWDNREVDTENIKEAAARIANAQKARHQGKTVKQLKEENSINDIDEIGRTGSNNDILPPDYDNLRIRRTYSVNDCTRFTEIVKEREARYEQEILSDSDDTDLEECEDFQDNFAYGGRRYDDQDELDCLDYGLKYMKTMKRKKFLERKKFLKKSMTNAFKKAFPKDEIAGTDFDAARRLKTSERSLSVYNYKEPEKSDNVDFIVDNKTTNKLKQLYLKIKLTLTQSAYFESLFPSIKEQKPGYDLYVFMAVVQVVIILFMIVFYTRMDPQYDNFSSEDLTPTTFNKIQVLAIFLQISIIVLDRYLYLSRDFVVIDQIEVEEEESDEEADVGHSESIGDFDRKKTFDNRSLSSGKLLIKTLGLAKKADKMKGIQTETKGLDEMEKEYDEFDNAKLISSEEVRLSTTNFNKTILLKYYLQLFLLIVIHVITFWYFPIKANLNIQVTPFCIFNADTGSQCNEVRKNWTLVVFYLLYCFYFIISAFQIRFGLPELRKGNFAMADTQPANKAMFQGYLAIPFIMELKIVSDWTFTKTALDLFQWIKFESVYADLFIAKCSNKYYIEHEVGLKEPWWKKASFGCGGLTILIIIIAGPLLLFSSFNPLAADNFVTGAGLTFTIIANLTEDGASNSYELFSTNRFQDISLISNEYYDLLSREMLLRNLDRELWQQIILARVSDSTWSISPPTQQEIFEKVLNSEDDDPLGINLVISYAFDRPEPAGQQRVNKELQIIDITDPGVVYRQQIKDALKIALNPNLPCNDDTKNVYFVMEDWFIPTIRLPPTIKPKLLRVESLRQDVYISRNCTINTATDQTAFWWEIFQTVRVNESKTGSQGLVFFTWSERVTSSLVDYPVLTFYIVIVLGIGRALRAGIIVNSEQIFIRDMPRPDSLLLICEGILISRLENNLEREEELYFVLIDIMRSPEILKMITKSSLKNKEEQ